VKCRSSATCRPSSSRILRRLRQSRRRNLTQGPLRPAPTITAGSHLQVLRARHEIRLLQRRAPQDQTALHQVYYDHHPRLRRRKPARVQNTLAELNCEYRIVNDAAGCRPRRNSAPGVGHFGQMIARPRHPRGARWPLLDRIKATSRSSALPRHAGALRSSEEPRGPRPRPLPRRGRRFPMDARVPHMAGTARTRRRYVYFAHSYYCPKTSTPPPPAPTASLHRHAESRQRAGRPVPPRKSSTVASDCESFLEC